MIFSINQASENKFLFLIRNYKQSETMKLAQNPYFALIPPKVGLINSLFSIYSALMEFMGRSI